MQGPGGPSAALPTLRGRAARGTSMKSPAAGTAAAAAARKRKASATAAAAAKEGDPASAAEMAGAAGGGGGGDAAAGGGGGKPAGKGRPKGSTKKKDGDGRVLPPSEDLVGRCDCRFIREPQNHTYSS